MAEAPLSVAVVAAVDGGDVLLNRRQRGAYDGLWALPGGKIEADEHVAEAAMRELAEEASVDSTFVAHRGIVSEHVVDGTVEHHFCHHVCELRPASRDVAGSAEEGPVRWFDADALPEEMVPSDRAMVERVVLGEDGYYECVSSLASGAFSLERFERR